MDTGRSNSYVASEFEYRSDSRTRGHGHDHGYQRDLGERELAHVDLARPVLESDVHDHAAGLHCGKRGVARRLGPDRIDHQVGGVVGHRLLRERIERTASGVLLERRAAQRIGLGDAHRAAAVVAGEQCREHADRAAADDEQRALPQRPMQRPHRQVERMQRGGRRLGERRHHRGHFSAPSPAPALVSRSPRPCPSGR